MWKKNKLSNVWSGPALTVGGRFGAAAILSRIAPFDAIRPVLRLPAVSDVFSVVTELRKRLCATSRSLWPPIENDETGPNVPSPPPGRIDTLSHVLKGKLQSSIT